jgi:hypothetical protein
MTVTLSASGQELRSSSSVSAVNEPCQAQLFHVDLDLLRKHGGKTGEGLKAKGNIILEINTRNKSCRGSKLPLLFPSVSSGKDRIGLSANNPFFPAI